MPSFEQIRQGLTEIVRDEDERRLCLCLVDEIERHLGSLRGAWTYNALSNWVNANPTDPMFQDCVNILASSPTAKALELHFLFFDPAVPDHVGTPLSPEEAALALREGIYVHPERGERVPDVKRVLVPYFKPAAGLREERGN